jgi:putative endonuclease
MKQIGVYILKGTRYYVGSTNDLVRRLQEHASGETHTTKRIGQWELLKFFACENIRDAQKLERQIKRSKNITRWL